MKKLINERLKKKTPKYAKILQLLSGAIGALPIYFNSLPQAFKDSIPNNVIWVVTAIGGILIFVLQLINE